MELKINRDALEAIQMTYETGGRDLPRFWGMLAHITGREDWQQASESHPVQVALGMHVCNVLSLLESVLILCSYERAQPQGIGVLCRSLYEVASRGVWIMHPKSKDARERRARSFFAYREKTGKALAMALAPKCGLPHTSSREDLKEDHVIRREINKEFGKDSYCLGFYRVLEDLGLADSYESGYSFPSSVTHGVAGMSPDMAERCALWAARHFLLVRQQAAEALSENNFAATFSAAAEKLQAIIKRRAAESMSIPAQAGVPASRDSDGNS